MISHNIVSYKWEKKGLLLKPFNDFEWRYSHVLSPVVIDIDVNTWRIFYSVRDKENKSRICYSDVEKGNPENIFFHSEKPLMELGDTGCFDDCGQIPSCAIKINNLIYLYYTGISVRKNIPFDNHTGLVILNKENIVKKYSGPVLGKTLDEPYFTGTFFVLNEENGLFRGYYMAGVKWKFHENKYEPFYNIKYCESNDGIKWERKNKIAVNLQNEEAGICQASVLKNKNFYEMWYCKRNLLNYRTSKENSYKIGYAISNDGIKWNRMDDKVGVCLSNDGWDSQMMCCPYIVKNKEKFFMFYSGNYYGKEGIGYAVHTI